jgi:hypothetical protein
MAWNGSGTFSRTNGTFTGATVWADDRDAGTKITAINHDLHDKDLADGINACLCKNGENKPSANIDWNGKKITNAAAATARTDYARTAEVQDSTTTYAGVSGGAADVQTLKLTPAIAAYATGQMFSFKAGFTNTGAATLNINGVGAIGIRDTTGGALGAGAITAGQFYEVLYDGTYFTLLPLRPNTTKVYAYGRTNSATAGSTAEYNIFDEDNAVAGHPTCPVASGVTFTASSGYFAVAHAGVYEITLNAIVTDAGNLAILYLKANATGTLATGSAGSGVACASVPATLTCMVSLVAGESVYATVVGMGNTVISEASLKIKRVD